MERRKTEITRVQVLGDEGWESVELFALTVDGGYARASGSGSRGSPWRQIGDTLLMFDKDEPHSCIEIKANWSVSEMLSFSVKDSDSNRKSWCQYAGEHRRTTTPNIID